MKKIFLLLILLVSKVCFSQIVTIPDANFKNYLTHFYSSSNGGYFGYDTNHDGEIQVNEIQNIQYLYLSNKNISDLTGIEFFTSLKFLDCSYNTISSLTLNNPNLESLYCSRQGNGNVLTNLDIMACPKLKYLHCGSNPLSTFNIMGLSYLITLDCDINLITNLDLTGLSSLGSINLSKCYALNNVKITGCSNLTSINIYDTPVTSFIFNDNPKLAYINIRSNPNLQVLDLTAVSNLIRVDCSNNSLTSLNISNLEKIENIDCNHNNLNKLDLNGLLKIKNLDCSFNAITELNVEPLLNIETINCENNALTAIKIKEATNLKYLYCNNNKIKTIDIGTSSGTSAISLICNNNLLEAFKVKRLISYFDCSFNKLTSLDLSNQPYLKKVTANDNHLNYVNLTNTVSLPFYSDIQINFQNNPSLKFVCSDEFQKDNLDGYFYSIYRTDVQVSSNCEFEPALYPNPVNAITSVTSAVLINTVNIMDTNGKVVRSFKNVNENYLQMDLSELLHGVYFVQVVGNYKDKYVTKFIKN